MTSTVVLFTSVTGALVVWWCLLIRGVPGLVRLSFEHQAARIQRELDEAVVQGRLPAGDPSVRSLSGTLDAVVDHSDRLTPAFSRMLNRVMNEYGRPLQVQARSAQSFADLSAHQRKLMHDLDRRLADALTFYGNYGSLSGWFHLLVVSPGRRRRRPGIAPDRRARPGEALVSTRLAMGALLDARAEPGLDERVSTGLPR